MTLGLISLVFLAAYIKNVDGVGTTETILIVVIAAMMFVLAISLFRWIKGQSIYWWTGHPDTSWSDGSRKGEERRGDVDELFNR